MIFYWIPQDPELMNEMLTLLDPEKEAVVHKVAETQKSAEAVEGIGEEEQLWDVYTHYTKHEQSELERIVGTSHVQRYINTETNVKLI